MKLLFDVKLIEMEKRGLILVPFFYENCKASRVKLSSALKTEG